MRRLCLAVLLGSSAFAQDLEGLDQTGVQFVPFGSSGSESFTVGGAFATDFNDAYDLNVHGAYSTFLVDDLELVVEGAIWWAIQPGKDALGLNPSLVFRHHLFNEGDWSFYLDAGIGAVVFTERVPSDGTRFNFTPRAGLGFTYALDDQGTRLQVGLRWHHYSNARIEGEEKNPARDGPLLYAGVVIPW